MGRASSWWAFVFSRGVLLVTRVKKSQPTRPQNHQGENDTKRVSHMQRDVGGIKRYLQFAPEAHARLHPYVFPAPIDVAPQLIYRLRAPLRVSRRTHGHVLCVELEGLYVTCGRGRATPRCPSTRTAWRPCLGCGVPATRSSGPTTATWHPSTPPLSPCAPSSVVNALARRARTRYSWSRARKLVMIRLVDKMMRARAARGVDLCALCLVQERQHAMWPCGHFARARRACRPYWRRNKPRGAPFAASASSAAYASFVNQNKVRHNNTKIPYTLTHSSETRCILLLSLHGPPPPARRRGGRGCCAFPPRVPSPRIQHVYHRWTRATAATSPSSSTPPPGLDARLLRRALEDAGYDVTPAFSQRLVDLHGHARHVDAAAFDRPAARRRTRGRRGCGSPSATTRGNGGAPCALRQGRHLTVPRALHYVLGTASSSSARGTCSTTFSTARCPPWTWTAPSPTARCTPSRPSSRPAGSTTPTTPRAPGGLDAHGARRGHVARL